MYEIGEYANAFLTIAVKEHDQMSASVERLNVGKDYFAEAMTSLGFKMLPSGGNFQHVAFGSSAPRVHAALEPHVMYRTDSEFECLNGFSRFSSTPDYLFRPIVELIAECKVQS